jgi:KDO2-lipid IV(A) lauroyltransferase
MKISITKNKACKGFIKWVEFNLARLAVGLLRLMSVRAAYRLGKSIGWLLWKLLRKRRATVRENLIIIRRWLQTLDKADPVLISPESIDAAVREVFRRSCANLVSSFPLSALPLEKRLKQIEFENFEVLHAAVKQGNGVVLLMAHMGPWESAPALVEHFEHNGVSAPMGAMYRPLNNNYLEKWYRTQRESQGMQLFNRKEGLRAVLKFLNSGGMLAVLADQRVKTGELSNFFGVPALTTPLVGLLAKRSKVSVVSLSLAYDQNFKLLVRFRQVSFEDANTRVDYAKVTNRELEQMLSNDVTNGFWLHRRFVT